MTSTDIFEYCKWLDDVQGYVELHASRIMRSPDNPNLPHDTDELMCGEYSLKGQEIEVSPLTGGVYITQTLLTFAEWLKQKEEMNNGSNA